MQFHLRVDSQEVAQMLGAEVEQVQDLLKQEVRTLAIRTHAFIVDKARKELKGFFYEYYLGRRSGGSGNLGENLKLTHISDTLHVIELDQKAAWIEEGRPATFMGDWMLNSPKAKTAKDGSKYIVIPMKLAHLAGPGNKKASVPALETMAKEAVKRSRPKIALKKIQYQADGKPVVGTIRKVEIDDPGRHVGGMHSRPRSAEMAALTGLPAHEGIFYGKGAALRQKVVGKVGKTGKAKVARDVGTFRVLSSKHKAEGRWLYPEVKAFGGIPAAYDWAQEQMQAAIGDLGRALGLGTS